MLQIGITGLLLSHSQEVLHRSVFVGIIKFQTSWPKKTDPLLYRLAGLPKKAPNLRLPELDPPARFLLLFGMYQPLWVNAKVLVVTMRSS